MKVNQRESKICHLMLSGARDKVRKKQVDSDNE